MALFLCILRYVLLTALTLGLLLFAAGAMPWLTTVRFDQTEHLEGFAAGGVEEPYQEWHSGLPWHFLSRATAEARLDIDDQALWRDEVFWFCVLSAIVGPIFGFCAFRSWQREAPVIALAEPSG